MSRLTMIAVLMVVVVAGCSLQQGAPGKPAVSQTQPGATKPRLDLQTRDDLRLLGLLLKHHDVLRARIVAEGLRGRIPEDDGGFAQRMSELDRQLTDQNVEAGEGYLWAHRPPTDEPRWNEAIATAQENLKRYGATEGKSGVAILRIRLEDIDREGRVGVWLTGLSGFGNMGGSTSPEELVSGGFLVVRKEWGRAGLPSIHIEQLRHASSILPVDVPESGVVRAGELLIRVVPKEETGSLHVRVLPEPGLSLERAVVRVGRPHSPSHSFYDVQPDGTCLVEGIGAGQCELYAEAYGVFRSSGRQVEIRPGQTTEIELNACAYRRVTIEWKHRRLGSEGGWAAGTAAGLTGRSGEIKLTGLQERGVVVGRFSEWSDAGAKISGVANWYVRPAEPGDFDPPRVRASREEFRQGGSTPLPIGVGKVFGMHCFGSSHEGEAEAVIRIRSIEPAVPLATQPAKAP